MVKGGNAGHVVSMTGFATRRGSGLGYDWSWDIRSVNGKGFDLRLRLPDWIEGLEPVVRATVSAVVGRGNVNLGLRLEKAAGAAAVELNTDALMRALIAVRGAEAAAAGLGVDLRPASVADLLAMRGVMDQGANVEDSRPLVALLTKDLAPLLAEFVAMRRAEGKAISRVIAAQVDQIELLTADARNAAEARRPLMCQALEDNLAKVMSGAREADPSRIAQELALLAVKADVTEELDRLDAHVGAARLLLSDEGTIGRKLDFLMQEFMREANTLCSKSGNVDLTRIGLDLKTVIDQMREQVQNVE
jgi:uncharacterized protein (TIGR00255 family)